jgi:ABC-2 type transport system permease protein
VRGTQDIIKELVRTNFKLKYRGSVLGFIWVLLKPFFLFMIMYLVFSAMSRGVSGLSSKQYAVHLLLGLIIFTFFNEGVTYGMNSILDKSGIILKINFDRKVAVFSSIFLAGINFVINLCIITVVAFVVGVHVTPSSLLYLLLLFSTVLILITGISFFTSIIMVRLRDLLHVTELVMQLLFYASAVFFPAEIVPEKWRFIILYNPLAAIIQAARSAVLFGTVDRPLFISAIFVCAVLIFIFGWIFFNKKVRKIAEYI